MNDWRAAWQEQVDSVGESLRPVREISLDLPILFAAPLLACFGIGMIFVPALYVVFFPLFVTGAVMRRRLQRVPPVDISAERAEWNATHGLVGSIHRAIHWYDTDFDTRCECWGCHAERRRRGTWAYRKVIAQGVFLYVIAATVTLAMPLAMLFGGGIVYLAAADRAERWCVWHWEVCDWFPMRPGLMLVLLIWVCCWLLVTIAIRFRRQWPLFAPSDRVERAAGEPAVRASDERPVAPAPAGNLSAAPAAPPQEEDDFGEGELELGPELDVLRTDLEAIGRDVLAYSANRADWEREMENAIGPEVLPHLAETWQMIQSCATHTSSRSPNTSNDSPTGGGVPLAETFSARLRMTLQGEPDVEATRGTLIEAQKAGLDPVALYRKIAAGRPPWWPPAPPEEEVLPPTS